MQKDKKSVKLIRFYQKNISTRFPRRCRYLPTCSQYMLIAVNKFGALKGTIAGIKRLFACVPWCRGGVDDVPEKFADCFKSLRFINYKLLHREYAPPKPYGFTDYANGQTGEETRADTISGAGKEVRSDDPAENRTDEGAKNQSNARNDGGLENIITRTRFD